MRTIVVVLCFLITQCLGAQTWLDPTFGLSGVVEEAFCAFADEAFCTVLQPDGKILVAGRAELYIGQQAGSDFLLTRFDVDGNLDTSFGSAGVATHEVLESNAFFDMALQPDGKIVLVGTSRELPSLLRKRVVLRFSADGLIDASFGTDGVLVIDVDWGEVGLSGVAIQVDGRIVVTGYGGFANEQTFYVARLNNDGSLDATFAGGEGQFEHSIGGTNYSGEVVIMSDGRIVAAGGCTIWHPLAPPTIAGVIIRYQADGTLDPSFGDDGVALVEGIDHASALAVQTDDKVVVTGVYCNSCNTQWARTARVLPDGSLDPSFGIDGVVTHRSGINPTYSSDVLLNATGNIMVAGAYRPATTEYYSYLVRLLDDGSLDPTFGQADELVYTATEKKVSIAAMALQPDGKALLVGSRSPVSELYHRHVFLLRYLTEPYVGIQEAQGDAYPVISADALGATLVSHTSGNMTYDVLDMLGRAVDSGRTNVRAFERSQITFASPLRNGTYTVVFREGGTTHSVRFIVTE